MVGHRRGRLPHGQGLVAYRFSVVTDAVALDLGDRAQPRQIRFAGRCARVRASDIPLLDLEIPGFRRASAHIEGESKTPSSRTARRAIVLGCGRMAISAAPALIARAPPPRRRTAVGAAVKARRRPGDASATRHRSMAAMPRLAPALMRACSLRSRRKRSTSQTRVRSRNARRDNRRPITRFTCGGERSTL